MRFLFLSFITLMFLTTAFAQSNWRVLIFSIGLYSLLVYWGYGYKWSAGVSEATKNIVRLRRVCLLLAYITFNALAAYNAYNGSFALVVYFIIWFVVTSGLLRYKWRELKATENEFNGSKPF